jgi:hypothetical protein
VPPVGPPLPDPIVSLLGALVAVGAVGVGAAALVAVVVLVRPGRRSWLPSS